MARVGHRYSVPRWHRPTKLQLEIIYLLLKAPPLYVCEMAVCMGTAGHQMKGDTMQKTIKRMEIRGWISHTIGKKRSYQVTPLGRAIFAVGISAGWAN